MCSSLVSAERNIPVPTTTAYNLHYTSHMYNTQRTRATQIEARREKVQGLNGDTEDIGHDLHADVAALSDDWYSSLRDGAIGHVTMLGIG